MAHIMTFLLLFMPAVVSVVFDSLLAKARKNIVSKYVLYALLNNITMMSAASLGWHAKFTPYEIGSSWMLMAIYGSISVASSVLWPIILCKRLPDELKNAVDYILGKRVAFTVFTLLTVVLSFLPLMLSGRKKEIFTCFDTVGRLFLGLVVAVLLTAVIYILKSAKKDGAKKTFSALKKRFSSSDCKLFKSRLFKALLVNGAFAFSVIMFIPFETYLGNAGEFVFEFSSIWHIVATETVVYVFFLTLLQFVFKNKAFDVAVAVVFGLMVAAYVQSMFLNGSMALMNGGSEEYGIVASIVNVAVWVIIVAVPVLFAVFGLKLLKTVMSFGCVLIVGMQAVALVSLLATVEQPVIETRLTEKGLYDVAPKDNVIVFVLDCFDQDNIDKMLEADETSLDGLRGFTCYDNMTGSYCYTHIAVPYLLSGERIPEYNPSDEQFIEALKKSPYFNGITDKVSSVGIYTEDSRIKGEKSRSKIDNISSSENSSLEPASVMVASQKASYYRVLPLCLKKFFNYTADDFNWAVESSKNGDDYYFCSPYSDVSMHRTLKKYGLSINKSYTEGSFRFIHTSGAHEPFRLDRDCNFSSTPQNATESSLGTMKIVTEYLKELNRLGVYEESTIIVTSDHGACKSYHVDEESELSINPVMLYKPEGVGYDEPMKRSTAPVSHDDIFPTVMDALGLDYEHETGMDIDEITEETERTRYYYWCRYEPDLPESGWSFMHVEYAIKGDSRFDENWHPTGNIVHCNGWDE